MWKNEAWNERGVGAVESDAMKRALGDWVNVYQGKPDWALPDKNGSSDVESFNFAKKLCNETARLTTLALEVTVKGSARADWLNGFMESYVARMKNGECEKACAFGCVILKPNGRGIDYVMPWDFLPTHASGGKIDGGIFFDHYREPGGKWFYTRLEWQRFEDLTEDVRIFRITNKAYRATEAGNLGQECSMNETVWARLQEDVAYENVERPLFSIFKMPLANHVDLDSPLGVSIFSNALKELKALDAAWTRLAEGAFDGRGVALQAGVPKEGEGRMVRGRFPREGSQVLQTADGLSVIDHFLDLVGVKCGYSSGQFVLNGRTGRVTVAGVKAGDGETICSIKQIRDSFQEATDDLVYALDKYADIYGLAPVGAYEIHYAFGNLAHDRDADRARYWQYVIMGKYPLWMYYVKFEGMSEKEARAAAEGAKSEDGTGQGLSGRLQDSETLRQGQRF